MGITGGARWIGAKAPSDAQSKDGRLSTLLSHSDRGQRRTALQLWLNHLSSSMSLARQLDPNERPFSMLTHSSGTCQKPTVSHPEWAHSYPCRYALLPALAVFAALVVSELLSHTLH